MAVETERSYHSGNGYSFGSMNCMSGIHDLHSDAMDDYDGTSGNKMGGRSGRRKQNKPIRVFMDVDPAEGEQGVPAPQNPNAGASEPAAAPMECQEMDLTTTITCDLCNEFFETQSSLTEHIQCVHQIDNEDNRDNFPTKYHQLGSEFQYEASSLATLEEGRPRNPSLPKPSFNGGDSNSNDEKKDIFHQDTYCELCDREFFNKFFLKTHRANKHGVFDGSPCPSPTEVHIPSLIPLRTEEEEMQRKEESPREPSNPQPVEVPNFSSSAPPAQMPQPMEGMNSMALQAPQSALSASVTPSVQPPSGKKIRASDKPAPDMEDYCELCQKHFCNKYYLKKHKQDVHGIVPENTPGSKRSRPSHNNSPLSVTSTSPNHLMLPQNVSPMTTSAVNGNGAISGLSSMANVMFINPFAPPLALLQNQQLNPLGFPPHLSGMPQMPPHLTNAESPKTSLPSNMSPNNGFLLGDPFRMGDPLRLMAGGEVSCDFCKKEFCNKYFLKIHQAIKHGVQADDLPLMLPGLPGMPDNLQSPNGKELGEVLIKKEVSSPSPTGEEIKQQQNQEICEICKKDFPNQFSLKIHLVNAHNQRLPDFDLLPELSKAENMSVGLLGGAMFNNMMAAKMADRVMCDICNKEVCNKYFLKTHKVKVHGMDPVQVDKELNLFPMSLAMSQPIMSMMNSPLQSHNFMSRLQSKDIPIPPPSDLGPKPTDSELLKMGIDPEAYCEICKKEFCSKYFLKTHKWNLHGIKTDGTPPAVIPPKPKEREPIMMLDPQIPPSNNSGRRNWKWKEPANSMRVMCELCNKELCNKYFLKTHMLNKHGINIDVSAGAPGFPMKTGSNHGQPPHMPGFPMPHFPFPFMKDENSNTSMPSTPSSENGVMEPRKAEPAESEQARRQAMMMMMDGNSNDQPKEPQYSPNVLSAKTWSVPDTKPLIIEPEGAMNLTNPAKPKESLPNYDQQVRGGMIPTTPCDYYKCYICNMKFVEKETLDMHLRQDHQDVTLSANDQTQLMEEVTSQKPVSIANLGLSLKRKYQFGVRRKAQHMQMLKRLGGGVSIADKVKSAIVNHIQNHMKKKKFKCAFCSEKFSLRSMCQQHIRNKHKRDSSCEISDDSSCSKTPSRPITAKPLTGADSTILQPFTVEEKSECGNFARSLIYLPVYNKISQPLSVTFNLTPTEH